MNYRFSFFFFTFLLLNSSTTSNAIENHIKTVVVLVMENRSFDHMLGWMKKLNPNIDGVTGSEFNLLSVDDPKSRRFMFKDKAEYVDPNPGHTFEAISEQVFGSKNGFSDPAPMNGFAQQAHSIDASNKLSESVMNGFTPDKVAVYKSLVSEFALFDRWFSSVPASAQPNRLYVHSATSHGATSNAALHLTKGYPQQTIFDNLHEAGKDFGIYFQNVPGTLFLRNLRKLKYLSKFHQYELMFKKHAKAGKLPNYVMIEPRYFDTKLFPGNDDHPSHDVYRGQMLVKEVYETLRSSPQWNQTLLLITYDEHGGFYDHVPTPIRGVPSPDGIRSSENFNFDRLGVRVPTIAVSPWIEKGTLVHGAKGPTPTSEYEHSSIPATVKKIFNLPNFLNKRDEWAGTFESILQTRKEPRTDCPRYLPTPVKIRKSEADEEASLSEFQQELIQLGAVLKGDNVLTSYPHTVGNDMNVKQGKEYLEDSVKRFFEAGHFAKKMQVSEEHIVQMKPSLTSRLSKSQITHP
ncbi:hypothetical protein TanjilG_00410 [Lupinus angustifolius]|uniref:Phospholipase C n=1 Tax=Lupinus angustifolius TaxID=3871 RepID=A0A1J7HCC9_LUPAN|nr:PREDICTED: non-specific phospholipase C2-like [Lupinus angustifolius]OIW10472.1 hypothetical protein TanjilG_00410 [Lupinus angustifolius]